jgi:hypothetical protein
MKQTPAEEERQFLESITAASQVRMSLAQLGIVVGSIACSAWWASTHLATKEDVKALEERSTSMSLTLREVTTTLAVLKDRSDRIEIPMTMGDRSSASAASMAERSVPVAVVPEQPKPTAAAPGR